LKVKNESKLITMTQIKINDIFKDQKGNLQKCIRKVFFSNLFKTDLYEFHSGKMEYESTILEEWKKENINYLPGEQLNLF
jgi:hypothetical protein